MLPTVRYLIVCEDVRYEPGDSHRITLVGLITAIRALEEPGYPLLHEEICAFVQLAGCRGPASLRIEIQHAESGDLVIRTQLRTVELPADPLEVVGMTFRLKDCVYREAGLYWVQLWYNDQILAQQPLILR